MIRLVQIILIYGLFALDAAGQRPEAYYVDWLDEHYFHGEREVVLPGGRADIVNDTYAIEVEKAPNWKNSIGQALWYGLQTNKKPGIVLVMENIDQRKYGIMLQSALDYAGIADKITVWFYPEDFGLGFSIAQPLIGEIQYSYNRNSGVRHNSNCTYFGCQNCVPCDGNRGRACGRCGG
ncbi:MAG TPA: hypothetical protein DCX89_09190 [Saprospirales bacterium]|nr:hypothetical protein [Saprospirales bacterium]HAY72050.1 hypothetical protein [Saprospirales bacterium]HRQ28801.1 hypothetical protein [Saprospiraceae bacterium]